MFRLGQKSKQTMSWHPGQLILQCISTTGNKKVALKPQCCGTWPWIWGGIGQWGWRALASSISFLNNAENILVPLSIAHGEEDSHVPVGEAFAVCEQDSLHEIDGVWIGRSWYVWLRFKPWSLSTISASDNWFPGVNANSFHNFWEGVPFASHSSIPVQTDLVFAYWEFALALKQNTSYVIPFWYCEELWSYSCIDMCSILSNPSAEYGITPGFKE